MIKTIPSYLHLISFSSANHNLITVLTVTQIQTVYFIQSCHLWTYLTTAVTSASLLSISNITYHNVSIRHTKTRASHEHIVNIDEDVSIQRLTELTMRNERQGIKE